MAAKDWWLKAAAVRSSRSRSELILIDPLGINAHASCISWPLLLHFFDVHATDRHAEVARQFPKHPEGNQQRRCQPQLGQAKGQSLV